jgi:site-specific recombinase
MTPSSTDLAELLSQLDPDAPGVQRHLWLIKLVIWLRGDASSVGATHARVGLLLDALQQRPSDRTRLQLWWQRLLDTVDATALLADHGFGSRSAFMSEMMERIRLKVLPGTPETADASTLFALVLNHPFDAQWLGRLDTNLLARLTDLLRTEGLTPAPQQPTAHPAPSSWQAALMESVDFCTTQICAIGCSPELRLRMSATVRKAGQFHALTSDLEKLLSAWRENPQQPTQRCQEALQLYMKRLDDCRQAAASVYSHLEAHGI